ncbi:hypothetical protein C8R46DRAFT_1192474 [Mycena filopes]|nr:hypothetical protein C8R46DRAFT_1192474 [Mycena filopes]
MPTVSTISSSRRRQTRCSTLSRRVSSTQCLINSFKVGLALNLVAPYTQDTASHNMFKTLNTFPGTHRIRAIVPPLLVLKVSSFLPQSDQDFKLQDTLPMCYPTASATVGSITRSFKTIIGISHSAGSMPLTFAAIVETAESSFAGLILTAALSVLFDSSPLLADFYKLYDVYVGLCGSLEQLRIFLMSHWTTTQTQKSEKFANPERLVPIRGPVEPRWNPEYPELLC